MFWFELRELRSQGWKFRRQAPIGPYVVDFFCPAVRLIVEIDGDSHETEGGRRHDVVRDTYLRSLGYEVVRVDASDVLGAPWHVAEFVKRKAEQRSGDPTRPLRGHPPLEGEGKQGGGAT